MDEYVQKLVITRLQAMPPNVSFSIGSYGDFSREDLIREVKRGSEVGKAAVEMELQFLREMPRISGKLGT